MQNALVRPERDLHGAVGVPSTVRLVLLALLVTATVACGSYRFPAESSPGTGTVSGQVTEVPCAPVEPASQPCGSRPVSGVEMDFSGNGTTVSTRTGTDGTYSVQLAAGTWKVRVKTYMRIISGPPTVAVTAGGQVVSNYILDSGIRVPVSKASLPQGTRLISLSGT